MLLRYAAGSRLASGARGSGRSGSEALAAGEAPGKVREEGAGDLGPPFDFEEKVLDVAIESCLLELFLPKSPMLGTEEFSGEEGVSVVDRRRCAALVRRKVARKSELSSPPYQDVKEGLQ